MSFTAKVWKDSPDASTPLSAAGVIDLETRVTTYADTIVAAAATPNFIPSDYGYLAWAYDPVTTINSASPTAGKIYVIKCKAITALSISNIHLNVVTAGVGLTSGQNFAALYQGAAKIGVSADQTTAWGSTGFKTIALSGGPYSVTAGMFQVVFWANASTSTPAFTRGSATTVTNGILSSANARFATADTGITTTGPSTLASLTSLDTAYWVAVS